MDRNIIVDIDGVIHKPRIIEAVHRIAGVTITPSDLWTRNLAEALGLDELVVNDIWEDIVGEPIVAMPSALSVLARLRAEDYKILINTHRLRIVGLDEIYDWLDENKVPFDEVLPNPFDFPEYAVAAIDDNPEKLLAVELTTTVKHLMLFSQVWNNQCRDVKHKFTRVNSWLAVEKIIKNQLQTH